MVQDNRGRIKPLRREVEQRLLPRLYSDGFRQHPSPLAHFGWSPGVRCFIYDLVRNSTNNHLDLLTVLVDVERMSVYLDFALLEGPFGNLSVPEIVEKQDIKTATSVSYHDIMLRFCRPNSWLPFGRIYRIHGRSEDEIARSSMRLISEIIKDLNALPRFSERNVEKRRPVNQRAA